MAAYGHTLNRTTHNHSTVLPAQPVTTGTSRNHDTWLPIHVRPSHTPPHRRPGWFVTLVNNAWSNDRGRCCEGTRGDDQSCQAAGITAIRYAAAVQASCARKYCAQRALCKNNVIDRWAGTTILFTYAEFPRAAE